MPRHLRLARAAFLVLTALAIGVASAATSINGRAVVALSMTAVAAIIIVRSPS
jgi:hypothetical protein